MIGYLEGTLRQLQTDRALVVAGGVGYLVFIPLSTYYKLEGSSSASLQIFTHVREDALALYGFATVDEKFAFEKLISISGIGPRLAQVILSGIEPAELAEAIIRGDTRRLSSIPGVGKKTSERICLELRDKLVLSEQPVEAPVIRKSTIHDDVQSALVNLGYKPATADTVINAARKELGEDAEFSVLLRASLRHLTK
ncbi:MAG TPA: Holliday junction branch migration protein RuvA [Thermoanaerobaculia bacterium]|nr:Holliday junction branch migration protein RuvA [Thermoanaerobaculia bacterium]